MTKPPHCGLRMSFGRYKGRQIIRVPDYYLLYLLGKGILGGKYLAHCQHRFSHISHIKNKINMNKQSFKKGDLVTCATFGQGEVLLIWADFFPVKVKFPQGVEYFTEDGRYLHGGPVCLHKGHIELPEPVLKSIPQAGDLVWVNSDECWSLVKVKSINGNCVNCTRGFCHTGWTSLEEGPLYQELKEKIGK
jgi:hypothetical protein